MKIENLVVADITLEVRPYGDRPGTGRRSRKYEVARFERAETAHIGNNLVNREEHLRGIGTLHNRIVYRQRKVDVVYIIAFYGAELAEHRRAIEALAHIPRLAGSDEPALPIARSKVNTHGYRIVIAVSKTCGDALAQLIYAHYNLGLIVNATKKIGHIEVLAVLYDSRIGFHKNDGNLWLVAAAIELNCVVPIILSYCYYLHLQSNFFGYTKPLEAIEHKRQMGVERGVLHHNILGDTYAQRGKVPDSLNTPHNHLV